MTTPRFPLLPFALLLSTASCIFDGENPKEAFHTSGSTEADQRAEQRVAKTEQLRGTEAESGDALYDRLGGEKGIEAIVADFVQRVIADPRANWERNGIERGGVLGIGSEEIAWKATPVNRQRLQQRLAEFVAVATGGPARYRGRDFEEVHAGMEITNAEFDAVIGALQASLDGEGVDVAEQRELLAIFESTRTQIAERR